MKAAKPGSIAEAAVAAVGAGATIGQLASALAGEATAIAPLPKHRVAERFEELRDAADAFQQKTGARPSIFLANLGTVAQHTGRATFAKNFFEVAGIQTVTNTGHKEAEAAAAAFKDSGARIAILCGTDALYEQLAPDVARALKAAGCEYLFLAGHPGDKRETYTSAGVDDFIFMGGDLLQTTRATLARLGVI